MSIGWLPSPPDRPGSDSQQSCGMAARHSIRSVVQLPVMPPASPNLVAAICALMLLAWFTLFFVDGIHNGLQRTATAVVGAAAALMGGHAVAVWRERRPLIAGRKKQR